MAAAADNKQSGAADCWLALPTESRVALAIYAGIPEAERKKEYMHKVMKAVIELARENERLRDLLFWQQKRALRFKADIEQRCDAALPEAGESQLGLPQPNNADLWLALPTASQAALVVCAGIRDAEGQKEYMCRVMRAVLELAKENERLRGALFWLQESAFRFEADIEQRCDTALPEAVRRQLGLSEPDTSASEK